MNNTKHSINTCAHLDKVPDAENNYHVVLAYYVTCIAEGAPKRKAVDAYCRVCNSFNKRLHACLECAFFGCFNQENNHLKDHSIKNKHYFAIDINHGNLFCFECDDYVYNEVFEKILNDFKLEARKISGNRFYMPWKPNAEEIELMKDKIKKISDGSYIGLRGIANIANNCYISVILQMFMHNPVMRDFFLSDRHKCFLPDYCLMCEMFVLFQEFYSGKSTPCDPSRLILKVIPKYSGLKVGDQHDTHQLFQEILTGLHTSCQKTNKPVNCNCMIHQIFYGVNESFIKCDNCKASHCLPTDEFMDILLDLDKDKDSLVDLIKKKFNETQQVLDHKCSACEQITNATMHQTIKKLPTVICFRMNIFREHDTSNQRTYLKKSTAFAFEEWIDLSKCLSSNKNYSSNSYAIENRYRLFAVITHIGKQLDQGHYSIYVQRRNQWYECDDEVIFERSLEDVLACEPFLLFYYKQL